MSTKKISLAQIAEDLALNKAFIKGQDLAVKNCWHFCTDGNAVDALFYNDTDFRNGMNRIYTIWSKFNDVVILAFCLMDTHVHFVLYGPFEQCNRFIHEYVRTTSIYISIEHGERKKLVDIPIRHQPVDTDRYLKNVICYTLKNPPAGGLPFTEYDYPWSSGALMFRSKGYWTSPQWEDGSASVEHFSVEEYRKVMRTKYVVKGGVQFNDGIVFPGEYVAWEIAEMVFRTHRSFLYFMCTTKDSDIESRSGMLSYLTIPMQEMRQHKAEVCLQLFGRKDIKSLDIPDRLRLARTLRTRYNSSAKQVARLCGLVFSEVENLL